MVGDEDGRGEGNAATRFEGRRHKVRIRTVRRLRPPLVQEMLERGMQWNVSQDVRPAATAVLMKVYSGPELMQTSGWQ